ncbi:MAG: hypothetical protein M5U34_38920 [Chloroflexi bacterium]|nr:hypothetical protein [Chloroflexota bacterium]
MTVLPLGQLATLAHVAHTNKCVMSLTWAGNMLILTAATDNLLKGASGQAVQNMNVMFGFEGDGGVDLRKEARLPMAEFLSTRHPPPATCHLQKGSTNARTKNWWK